MAQTLYPLVLSMIYFIYSNSSQSLGAEPYVKAHKLLCQSIQKPTNIVLTRSECEEMQTYFLADTISIQ